MLYIDIANILIIPGRATMKKSLQGAIVAYIFSVSRFILLIEGILCKKCLNSLSYLVLILLKVGKS